MKNKLGQSTLEYLFLTAIISVVAVGILKKVGVYIVGDGPCPNDSFLCKFQTAYEGGYLDREGNYRYFRLMR